MKLKPWFQAVEQVGGVDKSFGEWASCIMKARTSPPESETYRQVDKRLNAVYKTPLSEQSGSVGGYLVPYEWAYGLMQDIAENSIFWPRAFIQPMNSDVCMLPFPQSTDSAGVQQVSNLFGGMYMQWKSSQEAPETEPTFGQTELVAQELTGYQVASNQLRDDFRGLGAFLHQLIVRSVAWSTDQAFLRGQGAAVGTMGQPLGILNGNGTIAVPRNTINSVLQVDLATMMARLLPSSWTRAVWAISSTAIAKLNVLTSLGGILYYLPGEDGSAGFLYGRPFYITEKLPDVGTKGDVCLFDPSLYAIGHRGLYIDYSDQAPVPWLRNQSAWRVTWRGDGVPFVDAPITEANQSTTTVSPYVVLQ